MSWHCCPRCRLLVADDSETPFSERFDHEDGYWRWTLEQPIQQDGGCFVRVHGTDVQRCKLTLKPIQGSIERDPFHIEVDQTDFVTLESTPIGYVPYYKGGSTNVLEIGFAYSDRTRNVVVCWVRRYDSNKTLMGETYIPLVLSNSMLAWKLIEIECSDNANIIEVFGVDGSDPCCPPPPVAQCRSFDYDGRNGLNWVVRGLTLHPLWIAEPSGFSSGRVRVESEISTNQGQSLNLIAGFGDCCCGTRFEVSFEASSKTAYLRYMCGHGGPQLLAQKYLGGTFTETTEQKNYGFAVCLIEESYSDGETNYHRIRIRVSVTDTNGATVTGVMEGNWSVLYPCDCIVDDNGLLQYLPLITSADLFVAGPGTVKKASIDTCSCELGEPSGVRSECLDEICLGGYRPPEAPIPETSPLWKLEFSLPGAFAFANKPEFFNDGYCATPSTTETTSAIPFIADPQTLYAFPWIRDSIDAFISSHFSIEAPTWEEFCTVGTWRKQMGTLGFASPIYNICSWIWRPTRHLDTYALAGQIPLFIYLIATKRSWVLDENNHQAECWLITHAFFAGLSYYPNCEYPIQFQLLQQDQRATCYLSNGTTTNCPDCTSLIDLQDATATLTPYYE